MPTLEQIKQHDAPLDDEDDLEYAKIGSGGSTYEAKNDHIDELKNVKDTLVELHKNNKP